MQLQRLANQNHSLFTDLTDQAFQSLMTDCAILFGLFTRRLERQTDASSPSKSTKTQSTRPYCCPGSRQSSRSDRRPNHPTRLPGSCRTEWPPLEGHRRFRFHPGLPEPPRFPKPPAGYCSPAPKRTAGRSSNSLFCRARPTAAREGPAQGFGAHQDLSRALAPAPRPDPGQVGSASQVTRR